MIIKFKTEVLSCLQELNKQKDFAERLGLTRQYVKYKIDKNSFTRQELKKLREFLNIRNSDVLLNAEEQGKTRC